VKSQIAVAALLIAVLASPARAQDQKPAPPAKPASGMTPATLKVQLVLSRYQGEKRVSSQPYTLVVAVDDRNRFSGRATLRIGSQVPISTMSRQSGDANAPLVPTVQYRDVGTSIECAVSAREDGLYKIDLTIEESSLEATAGGASSTPPSFRAFRVSDSVLLRHGQSTQSSTATDKVGGEVWRVDVTLTVVR
jgi:hypothetical protein